MGMTLNNPLEGNDSVARLARTQQSAAIVSRVSEDEIEMIIGEYEKAPLPLGSIYVTRTINVE